MLGKFLKKTVLKSRRTFLGVAVLLFVSFAIPQGVYADGDDFVIGCVNIAGTPCTTHTLNGTTTPETITLNMTVTSGSNRTYRLGFYNTSVNWSSIDSVELTYTKSGTCEGTLNFGYNYPFVAIANIGTGIQNDGSPKTITTDTSAYTTGTFGLSIYDNGGGNSSCVVTFSSLKFDGVEQMYVPPPPEPTIVFESPASDVVRTVNFQDGSELNTGATSTDYYVNLYRTGALSFDTVQIKVPDSQTANIRTFVSVYTNNATPVIEQCVGTTGTNECNGYAQSPYTDYGLKTCTIIATGVCEISLGTEAVVSGDSQVVGITFDPNAAYQNFQVHTVYGDVGYSLDGGNGWGTNQSPVIKLCLNGCSDDLFNNTEYNSSYVPFTRVISLSPANGTTTATSSAFELEGTINIMPVDYVEGTVFRLMVMHKSSMQQVSMLQAWETAVNGTYVGTVGFEFPVSATGIYTFSTTSDFSAYPEGEYAIQGAIIIPGETGGLWDRFLDMFEQYGGGVGDERLYEKNSTFIIGQLTWYDEVVNSVVESRQMTMTNSLVCSPFSEDFEIVDCMYFLIVPSTAQLQSLVDNLFTSVLRIAPLGYVTRFLEIVTLSDPTMPPALTYTDGTSAPEALQDRTVSFQIFESFDLVTTIVADDGSNKNIWDIVTPFFDTIIALGVLGVILFDVISLGLPDFSAASGGYRGSGNVPVSQLPETPDRNKNSYEAQRIRIKDKTRRRG